MGIKTVKSDVPQPLANYAEAAIAGDLVFTAGQLASDFKTGVPQEARKHPNFPFYGSDIKLQTDFVLKNMAKTFKAAGTSLDHVIKAQVFLTDLNDFNGFDEIWKKHFKVPPPRTTIGTTGLLVKDTLVEIDLIATVPDDVFAQRHDWISGNADSHYDEHLRMLQAWRERASGAG